MNEPKPADLFVLRIPKCDPVAPSALLRAFVGPRPSIVGIPETARKWSTLGDLAGWIDEAGIEEWLVGENLFFDDLHIYRLPHGGPPVADPTIPATLAELLAPAQAAGTPASG